MFNIVSATGPGFPGPVVYESGNRKPEEVRPQAVAGLTGVTVVAWTTGIRRIKESDRYSDWFTHSLTHDNDIGVQAFQKKNGNPSEEFAVLHGQLD